MNWTAVGLERTVGASREGHILVSVDEAADVARVPLMLNLLLDRSGSMKGAPLAAAVEAALQLVDLAGPDDFLGLLTFDGVAEQRVAMCAMDDAGKKTFIEALAEVESGQGTALHQALELGARAVQRLLVPGRRPRLLLLTDGEPSVGPDSEAAFEALGAKVAQGGTSVHALGLARHYVPEILTAVTLPSGNAFEHVDGPEGLAEALGALFAHLFGDVASGVEVRLCPTGFSSIGCRHAYSTRVESDALVVMVGELSRAASRRVLFSGSLGTGAWNAAITGSAVARGDQRHQSVPVERVDGASAEGRLVLGVGLELDLVGAETGAWLALARRDLPRAESLLDDSERALRDLTGLGVEGLSGQRHRARLVDLRTAIERGDGDFPLLIRRAKSAQAGTHVSQVIPFPMGRLKH